MRARPLRPNVDSTASRTLFALLAATALALALASIAPGQSVDFDPAAISLQRNAILLKASRAPIAELENDVNRLAVLSETCRAESGAEACGLRDKPLESSKLEDRYAYYVRRPVEAHASGRQARIDRHNWEAPPSASR
jgi:hypothetical protein